MRQLTSRHASPCHLVSLDPGLRSRLETVLDVDLSAIRVCDDPTILARMQLPAGLYGGASGLIVYVSRQLPPTGRELVLAHEVFHCMEQANPQLCQPGSVHDSERAANEFARAFAAGSHDGFGAGLASPAGDLAEPVTTGRGFNAWEHRLLGDLTAPQLLAVALQIDDWQAIVQTQLQYLSLWINGVQGVTRAQINQIAPQLNVCDIGNGLLATTGELNALFGDYVITPADLQTTGTDIITPLLQEIRQESYNRLNALLGVRKTVDFTGAVMGYPGTGIIGLVRETQAIEALTASLGVDHYQGALARNACHFAPFSWFRWSTFHLNARAVALNAYQAADPTQKANLTNLAWITQSCAEHFFQDSFAAGHLANKNLVMQWFAEWAAGQLFYVANWDSVRVMTEADQPNLAGRVLYTPGYAGPSVDPQTIEELPTFDQRVASAPLVANGGLSQQDTYFQYLDFLASAVTQLGSNQVHNYYNEQSVVATSVNRPQGFRIYGDESMLSDGPNVAIISAALASGRAAIQEVLANGQTSVTIDSLLAQLPTGVLVGSDNVSLDNWHDDTQKAFCETLFGGYKAWAAMFSPTLGVVSIDQVTRNFGSIWDTSLPGADGTVNTVADSTGVFAGSVGTVFSLNLAKGSILGQASLLNASGAQVRIDLTETSVLAGSNGTLSSLARADLSSQWTCPLPAGKGAVSVLAGSESVLSGCNGVVYLHDLASGKIQQTGKLAGAGSYEVRLTSEEGRVYAGCNGTLYALDADSFQTVWSTSLTMFGGLVVNLALIDGGRIAASCNGYISIIDVSDGSVLKTFDLPNRGLHEVTLASDSAKLYAGITGHLLAFDLLNLAQAWDASLSSLPVYVAVSVTGGSVTAASNGYLYSLDPETGEVRHTNGLSGHGFKAATLSNNGQTVFCGIDAALAAVALI